MPRHGTVKWTWPRYFFTNLVMMPFSAIAGAIVMTEIYIALAMLPTSFVTNAAAFAVFLYLFLGLSRARVLDTLTKPVLRRYLATGVFLLAVIFGTATWL